MSEKTLKELALELRKAFEYYTQGLIDYPHSSGLVRGHYVWKIARKIAEKAGYKQDERIKDEE